MTTAPNTSGTTENAILETLQQIAGWQSAAALTDDRLRPTALSEFRLALGQEIDRSEPLQNQMSKGQTSVSVFSITSALIFSMAGRVAKRSDIKYPPLTASDILKRYTFIFIIALPPI